MPLLLFCFLFVGPTTPDEELTLVRANGTVLSNVSLLRIEGDMLVTAYGGDTIAIPVQEITEISSKSLVLGFSGCWFGLGVGAAIGAGCAAASGPYESPNGGEVAPAAAIALGASMAGCAGMVAGTIIFPENEERYLLSDKSVEGKKEVINSILTLHRGRHR